MVVDAVVGTVRLPGPDAGTWDDRLRRLASDFFVVLSEHPGLGPLVARNPRSPALLRLVRSCVELLCEAGFTYDEAVRAYAPLRMFIMGEVTGSEAPADEELQRRFEAVPRIEAVYPDLAEFGEEFGALDPREVYFHGIELFIAGYKAELANRKPDTDRLST
jgi:hypothetical protein